MKCIELTTGGLQLAELAPLRSLLSLYWEDHPCSSSLRTFQFLCVSGGLPLGNRCSVLTESLPDKRRERESNSFLSATTSLITTRIDRHTGNTLGPNNFASPLVSSSFMDLWIFLAPSLTVVGVLFVFLSRAIWKCVFPLWMWK